MYGTRCSPITTLRNVLDELDAKSIDMLRAIDDCDGAATTTAIREVTGLSNSQVAYRRDKLVAYDLITTRTGEPTGSRTPPKIHELTETAHTHVDAGLFELYNAPVTSDVEQLSTQYNYLRDRVDANESDLDRVTKAMEQLTARVDRLEQTLEGVSAELNHRVGTSSDVAEVTDGGSLAATVADVEAELESVREELTELEERKKDKFSMFQ